MITIVRRVHLRPILLFLLLYAGVSSHAGNESRDFAAEQRRTAQRIERIDQARTRIILFSLDPESRKVPKKQNFHGYKVLGWAEITDVAEKRDLLRSLARGIRENDGYVAACFNPRHGLRILEGERGADFVICFECASARAYGFYDAKSGFLLSGSPQQAFDAALRKHDIKLAPKSE